MEEDVSQKEEEKDKPKEEETTEEKKQESTSLIDAAREQADRIETANKKQEELLKKQEELLAKQALGGRAEAGQKEPEKKEMDAVEYSNKVLSGEINPLEENEK